MYAPRARILVIDKTPVDLMTLCAELATEFDVQFASTGSQGMALLVSHPPALILLGEAMYGVQGEAAGDDWATQMRSKGIPVVIVTAVKNLDADIAGLWPGAVDRVTTPVNVTVARQRIRNLIEREQLRAEVNRQREHLKEEVARSVKLEEQSERKQSQAALMALNTQLQESTEFLGALMEAIPMPIFYKNAQGRYLGFNQAYEVFMGRSRSELIGKSVFEIAPKELASIYYAQDLALMAQRGVQTYETQVKDGAGVLHDVMFNKACFTDHTGEVRGLIGCLLDITQRKQSERALALSEQRLKDAQRTSHVGNWELDLGSGELVWSDEIFRIFEIDKAHFGASFEAFLALIHPDDRDDVNAAYARSLDTRQPYAIDHRLLLPDGRVKYVHEACETSFGATGQPLCSKGTVQDITRSKLLENQIRQLAFYDPLTGLPNRRLLDDRLNLSMASSKRSGFYCALMFLDLDNFKPLNDAHGHAVGDLLLTEVADRLKACVREIDTVARLGGDEFVVLLDKLALNKADATAQSLVVAKKIRATLAAPYQLPLPPCDRREAFVQHHCSASIGVVVFFDHEASLVELLKWADAAMYKAKDAGRNTVRFHELPAATP